MATGDGPVGPDRQAGPEASTTLHKHHVESAFHTYAPAHRIIFSLASASIKSRQLEWRESCSEAYA
jgi:hypothetical protein